MAERLTTNEPEATIFDDCDTLSVREVKLKQLPRKALPIGIAPHDLREDIGRRLAAERRRAGQHLEQDAAERPDVGALVDRAAAPAPGSCTRRFQE